MRCQKCKITMVPGKGLLNVLSGIPDFIGDDTIMTVSPDGTADLVDCMKCPQCGYSVTTEKQRTINRRTRREI